MYNMVVGRKANEIVYWSNILKFEWDQNKNKINKIKHKVSFEEASTIFFNSFLEIPDIEHSINEERFIAFGISALRRELFACYCYRHKIGEEEIIRIISAREATKEEKEDYFNEG